MIIVNTAWVTLKFRRRLIETIRASGREVVVITERDSSFETLRSHCDELLPMIGRARSKNVLLDIVTLIHLALRLWRLHPAAMLSFTIKPNIYASIAARALGIPAINNITGLGTASNFTGWQRGAINRLYSFAFKNSRRVFFQNEKDLRSFTESRIVAVEKAKRLPGSGVDIGKYTPQHGHIRHHPPRFVMIARLLKEKGVKEYAAAARIVRQEFPDVIFELWGVLDETDARYVNRSHIQEWQNEKILNFYGEAENAMQALSKATYIVLPTYYPEGTPRVLLEAASMGIPAITTDIAGCKDVTLDGITGFLCRPRDVDSLVATMRLAITQDEVDWKRMSQRAREHILKNFDEQIVLDAYLAELDQIGA